MRKFKDEPSKFDMKNFEPSSKVAVFLIKEMIKHGILFKIFNLKQPLYQGSLYQFITTQLRAGQFEIVV